MWWHRHQVPMSARTMFRGPLAFPAGAVSWTLVSWAPGSRIFDLVFEVPGHRSAHVPAVTQEELPQVRELVTQMASDGTLSGAGAFLAWLTAPGPVWGSRSRRGMAGVLLDPGARSMWLPGRDVRHRVGGQTEPSPLAWSEDQVRTALHLLGPVPTTLREAVW